MTQRSSIKEKYRTSQKNFFPRRELENNYKNDIPFILLYMIIVMQYKINKKKAFKGLSHEIDLDKEPVIA
jgi:hypothetical protein